MAFPQETVSIVGSGLTFINTYNAGVGDAYHEAILYAERLLENYITDPITIRANFGFRNLSGGFLAFNNFFNTVTVSYASLTSALANHATSADDLASIASFPATAPSNGLGSSNSTGFLVTSGMARVLGLEGPGNSLDDTVDLSNNVNWSFDPHNRAVPGEYDAIGDLEHELSEGGLGRVGGLGYQNSSWAPLDLFRFGASGNRDYTGGQDGVTTYFSPDGSNPDLNLPYYNPVNSVGHFDGSDPGDWGVVGDSFGDGQRNRIGQLSATDIRLLDVLGWTIRTPKAAFTPDDASGDGHADVLWRDSAGALAVWNMNGSSVSSGFVTSNGGVVAPPESWSVVGTSDFNNDGHADILWQSPNGALVDWTMNGSVLVSGATVTMNGAVVAPDPTWSVAGFGDFNGDGNSDILWRHSTDGILADWSMNGASITSSSKVTYNGVAVAPDSSWSIAGIGDFDGNNSADIIWRNAGGELAEWQMNGSTIAASFNLSVNGAAVAPDSSWSVAGIGDFDGDFNADMLWRSTDGSVVVWLMNGPAITSSGAVTYNGAAVSVDAGWYVIDVSDFDGDGNSDVLWRNDNGTMAEWLMNGTQIVSSGSPTSQGAAPSPGASWQTLNRPIDFA